MKWEWKKKRKGIRKCTGRRKGAGKRKRAAPGWDIPCASTAPTDEKIGNLGKWELKSGMWEAGSDPNSNERKMQRLKTELKSIFL